MIYLSKCITLIIGWWSYFDFLFFKISFTAFWHKNLHFSLPLLFCRLVLIVMISCSVSTLTFLTLAKAVMYQNCSGAAPRGGGGGNAPYNFIFVFCFVLFLFLFCLSAQRSVMCLMMIPLPHCDNLWTNLEVAKIKQCVGVPPPPPPP